MKHDVVIVGGGVSALMNAYYLSEAKLSVCIIDKDLHDMKKKASYGNAGLLSAFAKDPLSHPGIFTETLKMLLMRNSPLSLASFPTLKTMIWGMKFFFQATESNTRERMKMFERFGEMSFVAYEDMQHRLNIELDYSRDGLLNVIDSDKSLKAARKLYAGRDVSELGVPELDTIAPLLDKSKIKGAFLLHKNARINPAFIITNLTKYLQT